MSGALQAVFQNQRSFVSGGSQTYTGASPGNYSWVAPAGVTSVSVLAVGAGGNGGEYNSGAPCNPDCQWSPGGGGGGGGLAYLNNYAVTPGNSYAVTIDCNVSFVSTSVVGAAKGVNGSIGYYGTGGAGLGTSATKRTGGRGGTGTQACTKCDQGPGGGGGAAGYSGTGGAGGCGVSAAGSNAAASSGGGGGGGSGSYSVAGANGGGVGICGLGTTGTGGAATIGGNGGSGGVKGGNGTSSMNMSAATRGTYGGGGGGISAGRPGAQRSCGGYSAVRIVWPGASRSFPSTCVGAP